MTGIVSIQAFQPSTTTFIILYTADQKAGWEGLYTATGIFSLSSHADHLSLSRKVRGLADVTSIHELLTNQILRQ